MIEQDITQEACGMVSSSYLFIDIYTLPCSIISTTFILVIFLITVTVNKFPAFTISPHLWSESLRR